MSYSFNIKAPSAALAIAAIGVRLDTVVEQQPIHARDRQLAEGAAREMLALLDEPGEGQEFSIAVTGSVSRAYADGQLAEGLSAASLSIYVSTVSKTG